MIWRVLLDGILNRPHSPETVKALLAEVEEAQARTRQQRAARDEANARAAQLPDNRPDDAT